jgi:hypothetical protein
VNKNVIFNDLDIVEWVLLAISVWVFCFTQRTQRFRFLLNDQKVCVLCELCVKQNAQTETTMFFEEIMTQ